MEDKTLKTQGYYYIDVDLKKDNKRCIFLIFIVIQLYKKIKKMLYIYFFI